MDLKDKVFEVLDNGLQNEPEIANWTAEDIAYDLIAYCSDFEDEHFGELVPHMRAWLNKPKN